MNALVRSPAPSVPLRGVDFSSAPSRRKPIVEAQGWRQGSVVHLQGWRRHASLPDWQDSLREPGPWIGGFDLPFGLPRELVVAQGWPLSWAPLMRHYTCQQRDDLRARFAAFCAGRPAGGKFAHRRCDGPAGASPSMKWVNPPVAWMLHAGVAGLLAAGVSLPGLHDGDPQRLALEAYPGLLAREVLGRRSYKSDDVARQTPDREQARGELLQALRAGCTRLGLRLQASPEQCQALCQEPRGDLLDAVLCLMQVAWSLDQPRHGWPPEVDPLEGWILTAPWAAA
ncbi:DUF429 domain-containing protein [Ideonella livida]|uniref:DUF429 domain-containing protein n=1 Tax=Ideonella livida TaxID=2707176 RepID=A0A7C9PFL3_9BURK|nr:DUF429 domain-containing protein [Ideonella livida]NDY89834.1 DUF429 domain-containing protein [Ideonella livida]